MSIPYPDGDSRLFSLLQYAVTRNNSYPALILRSRPSGEHRDVWLLADDAGLLRVTVFGGPKSRLRSYASPFHSGQAWVYHDPSKDNRKLTDFDVQSWRPGLRELYERAMAADAVAETVLESHGGGGNWGEALALTEAALDTLAIADNESCVRILPHFLWQWAGFLGLRPDLNCCSQCGKPAPANATIKYFPAEGGVVCSACQGDYQGGFYEAGPGCRRWLEAAQQLSPAQPGSSLDGASFRQARSLVTAVLAEALGKRLASWEW